MPIIIALAVAITSCDADRISPAIPKQDTVYACFVDSGVQSVSPSFYGLEDTIIVSHTFTPLYSGVGGVTLRFVGGAVDSFQLVFPYSYQFCTRIGDEQDPNRRGAAMIVDSIEFVANRPQTVTYAMISSPPPGCWGESWENPTGRYWLQTALSYSDIVFEGERREFDSFLDTGFVRTITRTSIIEMWQD